MFRRLREITGTQPAESTISAAYTTLLEQFSNENCQNRQVVYVGQKSPEPRKLPEIERSLSSMWGAISKIEEETLIAPQKDAVLAAVQKVYDTVMPNRPSYQERVYAPGDDPHLRFFNFLSQLTGQAPKLAEGRVHTLYQNFFGSHNFHIGFNHGDSSFQTADAYASIKVVRERSGISPSEDLVQSARETIFSEMKKGKYHPQETTQLFDRLSQLDDAVDTVTPAAFIEAKVKDIYAQLCADDFTRFFEGAKKTVDAIVHLRQISKVEPELAVAKVQQFYNGLLQHREGYGNQTHHLETAQQLYNLTEIRPELPQDQLQKMYAWMIGHGGIKDAKTLSDLTQTAPKLGKQERNDAYAILIQSKDFEGMQLLKEMLAEGPSPRVVRRGSMTCTGPENYQLQNLFPQPPGLRARAVNYLAGVLGR